MSTETGSSDIVVAVAVSTEPVDIKYVVHFRRVQWKQSSFEVVGVTPDTLKINPSRTHAKGGATVVVLTNGRYGIAVCSVKDNYDKKKGRKIALDRALAYEQILTRNLLAKKIPTAFGLGRAGLLSVADVDLAKPFDENLPILRNLVDAEWRTLRANTKSVFPLMYPDKRVTTALARC